MDEVVKLLKSEAVTKRLDVSPATLSRMVGAGQIPHIVLRTGRRKKIIRFRAEEIEAWLRTRTHGGAAGQGSKRTRGRIGNNVATQKLANLQVRDSERENDEGHQSVRPVSGA